MNALHDRLVLSHFTLPRHHPLDDRIRVAGVAGYAGIGLFAGQYGQLLASGWSPGRVHDLLDEACVVLDQVEVLSGWGAATPSDGYWQFEQLVWNMVDEFGASYVQTIGPYEGSVADAADRFGALCDRAADHGATVGLEFLPFTNIVDADQAVAIVEAADRPNGGVCLDIWHHARGADDLEMLRRLPPELIVRVQMNDGPKVPKIDDYKDDCLRFRVPPGTGQFDVDAVVAVVLDAADARRAADPQAPPLTWDLEVPNEEAHRGSSLDHARACAAGLREVIARVRSARPTR